MEKFLDIQHINKKMRFECSFCGKDIVINEIDFAMWSKGHRLHCAICHKKLENNINETMRD